MQNGNLQDVGEALKTQEEIGVLTAGCSMRPMLREHKDVVIITRIDRKLKKGDVVVYLDDKGRYVLHRIMRTDKNGYVIRGDNNYFTERGITDKDIVGVLKEFYRSGKYISCAADKKYRLYVFWIMHSYWLRCLYIKGIHPILIKIKHLIFGDRKILKKSDR